MKQDAENAGVFETPADARSEEESLVGIGALAREFNVSLRTLRYYQSKGLLGGARQGKDRVFSADDRDRLALVLQGKKLGFTLLEIRNLIGWQGDGSRSLGLSRQKCLEQIGLLEKRKSDLEAAIGELRRIYTAMFAPDEPRARPLRAPEPDRKQAFGA